MLGGSTFASVEFGGIVSVVAIITFASGKKAYLFNRNAKSVLLAV
jgi:hypothetical protein